MTPLRLLEEAGEELEQAAIFYEGRQGMLGSVYVTAIKHMLGEVSGHPHRYPLWPDPRAADRGIRKAIVAGFPFSIAYEIYPDLVVAIAIVHASREPLYWLARSGKKP